LYVKNRYNIKNCTTLVKDLTKIKTHGNHKMMTFDTKHLNVNTPINETLNITKYILLRHNEEQTTNQIIALLHTILQPNYFTFGDCLFQPQKGIAMGSPISGTIAEIFLQPHEEKHLKQLLDARSIIFYTSYVDEGLIIHYNDKTQPDQILKYLNSQHPRT
jgi:hypothetical protein